MKSIESNDITLDSLSEISTEELLSFIDSAVENRRVSYVILKPFLNSYIETDLFKDNECVQIAIDYLELELLIQGTNNRTHIINMRDILIDFIQFFATLPREKERYLVSHIGNILDLNSSFPNPLSDPTTNPNTNHLTSNPNNLPTESVTRQSSSGGTLC